MALVQIFSESVEFQNSHSPADSWMRAENDTLRCTINEEWKLLI